MYKVDAFSAIITPPQAAILAVGSISDRVVPVDGKPGIRPMMTMTLSSDHRMVDGARAAEILKRFGERHSRAREVAVSGCVHKIPWKGNEYFSRGGSSRPSLRRRPNPRKKAFYANSSVQVLFAVAGAIALGKELSAETLKQNLT